MSKEVLNKLIVDSLADRELNARMQDASRKLEDQKRVIAEEALGDYDLTAEEREAVISKDFAELMALGVVPSVLKRADWCTGE